MKACITNENKIYLAFYMQKALNSFSKFSLSFTATLKPFIVKLNRNLRKIFEHAFQHFNTSRNKTRGLIKLLSISM